MPIIDQVLATQVLLAAERAHAVNVNVSTVGNPVKPVGIGPLHLTILLDEGVLAFALPASPDVTKPWGQLITHHGARLDAAARASHAEHVATILAIAEPLIPQCCLDAVTELSDTHGSHVQLALASRDPK